jgi:acetyl esterase/lipase
MNRKEFLKTLVGGTASLFIERPVWAKDVSEPKTFTYKSVGGLDIQLDAYDSDPRIEKQVYVYIHGGALMMGSRKTNAKWLNPQGERVLISLDYRLAPETKLPGIIEDVQDAFRWIHNEGPSRLNIDPSNIVVVGESAGGYLTLMSGFCIQPRPRALLSVSGYGNIIGSWYSRPSDFYLHDRPPISKEEAYKYIGSKPISERDNSHNQLYFYCRQKGTWPQEVAGHDPDREAAWFKPYCPVQNVTANYPPTILIHGTADTDVPWSESDAMDKALTRAHVRHEFLSVPGAGHVLGDLSEEKRNEVLSKALTSAGNY